MEFIEITNKQGVIKERKFYWNGFDYEFIGAKSGGFQTSVWQTRDTLKRSDGQIIEGSRRVLSDYFGGRIKDKSILAVDFKIIKPV